MAVVVYSLLLFMLISASSMSEFHMLVAIVVMFNMLELILELLPNFPTGPKSGNPDPLPASVVSMVFGGANANSTTR